uniref:radical SAM/SPASM domain-containing protein n=1 Tax=Sphingomonas bacterium TaxID=1895847 RepID=UPI001C2CF620
LRERLGVQMYKNARYLKHRRKPGANLFFRAANLLDPGHHGAAREVGFLRPPIEGAARQMRFLAIGTTGTCNASCIHCPTGKEETSHVPRNTMSMELYRKLIDGIADHGITFEHRVVFGLFGDGLVDPLVEERARYFKSRLPDVGLGINTNGAAYGEKHKALTELIDIVSLHCESLEPQTYNELMQPLRLNRVLPRFEMLLRDFPDKVHVSVPVSRRNIGELENIRRWFTERGTVNVQYDPMSNRCSKDQRIFDSLSLGPGPIRCEPEVMNDLIVDCDGLVLACCQDFSRIEPIGNLAEQSFSEMLSSIDRHRMREQLRRGEHDDIATCARCRGDNRTPDFPYDQIPSDRATVGVA